MPCEPFRDQGADTANSDKDIQEPNQSTPTDASSSSTPLTVGSATTSSSSSKPLPLSKASTAAVNGKHYCCWKQFQQQQQQQSTAHPPLDVQSPARYLIIGLGNPGYPFSGTRHNIGRDFVSMMQKEWANVTRAENAAEVVESAASSSSSYPMTTNRETTTEREVNKMTFTSFTNHAAHQNSKPKKKQKRDNDREEASLAAQHNVAVERICASQVVSIRSDQLGELQARFNPAAAEKPRTSSIVKNDSSSSSSSFSNSSNQSVSKQAVSIPPCSCQLNAASMGSANSSSARCQCRVLLACLDSFMNLSGRPVVNLSRHFRVPASRLIVVYDDISLPLGSVRIKNSGSAGGQKGMESIISAFGGEKQVEGLVRIRIGIAPQMKSDSISAASKSKSKQKSAGSSNSNSSIHLRELGQDGIVARPFARQSDLAKFVLASFDAEEKQIMELVYQRVQKAIMLLTQSNFDTEQSSIDVTDGSNNGNTITAPTPASSNCACCCTFSLDSNASRERRLQKTMNRFNGLTITLDDVQRLEH